MSDLERKGQGIQDSFLCIAKSLVLTKLSKWLMISNCITIAYISSHQLSHSGFLEKYSVTNRGFSHFTT